MSFKNALRKFRNKILGIHHLTENEISEIIKKKIKDGGGQVGNNVDILSSIIDLGEPYLISIGNNVTITGAHILTHDASLKKTIGYSKVGKVVIGNNVFIGVGSIILPNTSIGDNVVIGAGTIVAKDIESNSVVVGNPGRVISSYDDYLQKNKDLMKRYPVIDKFPNEIMNNSEEVEKLIKSGFGYIK